MARSMCTVVVEKEGEERRERGGDDTYGSKLACLRRYGAQYRYLAAPNVVRLTRCVGTNEVLYSIVPSTDKGMPKPSRGFFFGSIAF